MSTVFVLLMLLVFGCAQQTAEDSDKGTIPTPPGQQDTPLQEQPAANPPDVSSFDLAVFVKSGAPIKCDIETYEAGTVKKETLYIKGNQLRVEAPLPDSSETWLELIMKGTDVFVPQIESPDCDWLRISPKNDTIGNDSSSTSSLKDFEIPPIKSSCIVDVFGDEKFDTPGKVCDFWDTFGK